MHALHAKEARRVGGYARDAHERAAHGGIDATREPDDFLSRAGRDDAAAKVDEGTLRLVDDLCGRLKRIVAGFCRCGWPHGRKLLEVAKRGLNILGDVHEHGSLAARHRKREGLANDPLQAAHIAHEVVVLRDRQRDARDVQLLEGVRANAAVGDVAGDGDERYRVEVGRGDARHKVRGTGPRGGQNDAAAARRARVAVRRVAGVLLVRGLDVVDLVGHVIEHVVDVDDRTSGIAEDRVNPLVDEAAHQDLGAVEPLHAYLPSSMRGASPCARVCTSPRPWRYSPALERAVWIMRLMALT